MESDDSDDNNMDEDFKRLASKRVSSASESSSNSDTEWSTGGKMKRKKKTSVSSPPLKKARALDAEEGEVTDSDSDDEFDDGLDDQLIRDEEDRRCLEGMSEKEREQELYNRIEKREALKTRFEIEKKMKETRRQNRLRSSENRVAVRRKSMDVSRQESKRGSALDSLKARREEKKIANIQKEECEQKKKKTLSSIYSDDEEDDTNQAPQFKVSSSSSSSSSSASDNDDEDEVEARRRREEVVSSKEQLEAIRLSRHKLEKWCHYPMLEEVIKDCYVKIGVGRQNGKQVYRVARIVGVVETPKVYELESTRTNKGLKLKYGKSEQMYRLKFVSNQEFTDGEFERWKAVMAEVPCAPPLLYEVQEKMKVLKETMERKFTDEELNQMIAERKRFQKVPSNYALEKTELRRQLDFAMDTGDREKENALRNQIENLEEQAAELYKKRTNNISSIGFINERNRKKNMEDMVEACKREVAEMKNAKPDPFTRRQCRPTLVTKSRDADTKTSTLSTDDTQEDSQASKKVEPAKQEHTHSNNHHNDLFSIHDFDISIDLGIEAEAPKTAPASSSHKGHEKQLPGRRHLNLDEYKKKRGLI